MYSDEELQRINSTSFFEKRKIKYSFQDNHPEIKTLAKKLSEKIRSQQLGLVDVSRQTNLKPSEIHQFLKGADLGEEKHSAIQQFLETSPPSQILDNWEIWGEECEENVEICPVCLSWARKGLLDHICF